MLSVNIWVPNWFSDIDASVFANAEASFNFKIRKPDRVSYNKLIE